MDLPLAGRDEELAALRALLDDGGCLVLAGPAGVGKTRLTAEAARAATSRGMAVETLIGSATAQSLLFAAAAHLVPPVQARSPHELLAATVSALRTRAEPNGLLLVVDDAHLLDPATATLVQQVAASRAATIVATVRTTDAPMPDAVVALWAEDAGRRLEVGPLKRRVTRLLLEAVLDGDVAPDLEEEVWRLSQGFPMYVREALLGAEAAGTLVRGSDGVWSTAAPLSLSARLVDLVQSRMEVQPERIRDAMETLAVAEPMPRDIGARVLSVSILEELEHRALVDQERQGGRLLLRLVHPLYGEVLRALLTQTRAAALAARWADAVIADASVAPGDLLRAASLLLDAGRDPDPRLALAAAGEALARFEGHLAERLARVALNGSPVLTTGAQTVLGMALQLQGDIQAADEILAAAMVSAHDDAQRVQAVLARARNRHWSMGDRDGAMQLLQRALHATSDEASKGALEAELALYYAVVGDPRRAGATAAAALERGSLTPRTELNVLVVLTLAQSVQGRLAALSGSLDHALDLARRLRADEPLAEDQLLLNRVGVLMYDDVAEAATLCRARAARRSPMGGMWWASVGMCALLAGDVRASLTALRDAVANLEHADPFANLPMVRSIRALAVAQTRDAALLNDTLARIPDSASMEPRARVWRGRALAWSCALSGDAKAAADLARNAGSDATEHGHVVWGATALHDAVRFGRANTVVDALDAIAGESDAPVLELFADHARALVEQDAPRLARTADGFAQRGFLPLAAEAYAQAAQFGDVRVSAAGLRAAFLAARTVRAWKPGLSPQAAVLSERETEIAELASQGLGNRDIATRLFLSHRTVENHLGRIYRRFALSGRDELQEILDDRFIRTVRDVTTQ